MWWPNKKRSWQKVWETLVYATHVSMIKAWMAVFPSKLHSQLYFNQSYNDMITHCSFNNGSQFEEAINFLLPFNGLQDILTTA